MKRLVIAGASGVLGRHLRSQAEAAGFTVRTLTRGRTGGDAVHWDPAGAAAGDPGAVAAIVAALEDADVLVNLAGEPIAGGRLGEAHRERVLASRVDATTALVRAHAALRSNVAWLQASAVGYYGHTGEVDVAEDHAPGGSFLADVCERWEAAARPAEAQGARVAILRIGVVLARDAPGWQKMVLPIRLFAGGPLGSGRQWMPWVHAHDVAAAALFLAGRDDARGAFNVTAPEPVRQADLVRAVARRLHRPSFVPTPRFALRLAVGGLADDILQSCRAVPRRLVEAGFVFRYPTVESALADLVSA